MLGGGGSRPQPSQALGAGICSLGREGAFEPGVERRAPPAWPSAQGTHPSNFPAPRLAPLPRPPRPQAFPDAAAHPQYRSMLSSARYVLASPGGVRRLFSGLLPRALRNCGAVLILSTCQVGAGGQG